MDSINTKSADQQNRDPPLAWFILFVVTVFNILNGIHWIAFSVLYVEFTEQFQATKSQGGWIGSLQVGVTQLFALVLSPFVQHYGCRPIAMLGGVTVALSVVASSWASSIWHLYVTYGVLSGMGSSCMYLTGPVIVQQHFKKNRALAAGIAMAGLTIGNFLGPLIIHPLIKEYGWRGAMLVHAGVMLNCLVLGALFYPPHHFYKRNVDIYQKVERKEYDDVKDKCEDEDEKEVLYHTIENKEVYSDGLRQRKNIQLQKEQNVKNPHEKITLFLKGCCDFSLLCYPPFFMYCISLFCLKFNSVSFWQHVLNRAIDTGIHIDHAVLLLSIISVSILCSRLVFSFIANLNCVNRILLYAIGEYIGGISSFCLTFAYSYPFTAFASALMGFHLGISTTITTVVLVDLLGLEKLPRAQAINNSFYGAAALICTPFAGWLFDISGDYNIPFYVTGSFAIFGGTLGILLNILHIRVQRKARKLGGDNEINIKGKGYDDEQL